MIPWDTFKTPQDAYEWAKRNANQLVLTRINISFKVWIGCQGRLVFPTDCVAWRLRR